MQIPLEFVKHKSLTDHMQVCRSFGITHDHLISVKFQKGAFSKSEFCDVVRSSLVGFQHCVKPIISSSFGISFIYGLNRVELDLVSHYGRVS